MEKYWYDKIDRVNGRVGITYFIDKFNVKSLKMLIKELKYSRHELGLRKDYKPAKRSRPTNYKQIILEFKFEFDFTLRKIKVSPLGVAGFIREKDEKNWTEDPSSEAMSKDFWVASHDYVISELKKVLLANQAWLGVGVDFIVKARGELNTEEFKFDYKR